ncbi:hypothetical protein SJX93_33875 [Streptomyces cyaneofuscatus]|uniref:hypothetical protein n=1 Tax=Streptomyces cyaneofuscatus TaxID=66883 RepID=UPI002D78D36C|nr:hypothetical protein [Streptomyces cyaneofuscatus]WRO14310.1 hypothetical protein SJX93_33875 [Streptomyces cyaneofuscatus]
MRRSRGAELGRARVAALIASAAVAVSGCSGGGQEGAGGPGKPAARAPGVHSWTGSPCALLADTPLARGFTVGSTTDSADPDAREDIGENGARPRYRQTGCLADLTGPDGALWRLSTTAAVYENVGPAHHAYRVKEGLDRAHGRGPQRVHDAAYAKPADDQGRPGRTLLLWNGDLLLSVTAYAPYGSKEHDVRDDIGSIVENTARLMEDGLRVRDAPSPTAS